MKLVDIEFFYGMTVEQIREVLKNLPEVDEKLYRKMQFTGSGMTRHGFMISSCSGWIMGEDGNLRACKDEAECIYVNVNTWGPDGCRRKE